MRLNGPCLCGDPYCGRCFPQPPDEFNPDDAYERDRQKEIDDEQDQASEIPLG